MEASKRIGVSTVTTVRISKGKVDEDLKNWLELGQRKRTALVGVIARICLACRVEPTELFKSRGITLSSAELYYINNAQTRKNAMEPEATRVEHVLDEVVTPEDVARLTQTQEAMGSALTIREVTWILLAWHAERKEEHGSPD